MTVGFVPLARPSRVRSASASSPPNGGFFSPMREDKIWEGLDDSTQ